MREQGSIEPVTFSTKLSQEKLFWNMNFRLMQYKLFK